MMGADDETTRRVRNAQGEGVRLRHELLTAAGRLLGRTGNGAGLSLRAVAREAGVAAPSVYLHFASKQALLREVLLGHYALLRDVLEQALVGESEPAARFRAGCLAYCRFASEQPDAYRVMFGGAVLGLADEAPDELPGLDTFDILVDGVVACIETGVARPADPLLVATRVWTALHGIVSLREAVPVFPWPPVPEMVEGMLVGLVGLSPPASTGAPASEAVPGRPTSGS
jgi:AcrR family transcriptional regulator